MLNQYQRATGCFALGILSFYLVSATSASPAFSASASPQEIPIDLPAPPVATIKFDTINVRTGPDVSNPILNQVHQNESFGVSGRNADGTWLELCCIDGDTGWIPIRLVWLDGIDDSIPVVDDEPILSESLGLEIDLAVTEPISFQYWKTEYFDNTTLTGEPVAFDDVPTIDFDWGAGAPHINVPADGFSVRFERELALRPGFYRFTAQADDGLRIWLDEHLLIDQWDGATGQAVVEDQFLAENPKVRIEYHELSGSASIRFSYEYFGESPDWSATYFSNIDLSGEPALSRLEAGSRNRLDRNWGNRAPATTALPANQWSARWRGTYPFEHGDYEFRAISNGGARVYLNEYLVVDGWQDGFNDLLNTFQGVGAEDHTITVEYYNLNEPAKLQVWWTRVDATNLYLPMVSSQEIYLE